MNVTASITGRDELAAQIEVFRRRAKDFLLVVRVVDGRRQSGRDIGACERPTGLDAVTREIIGVGQIAQRGGHLSDGSHSSARKCVVSIHNAIGVWTCDTGLSGESTIHLTRLYAIATETQPQEMALVEEWGR